MRRSTVQSLPPQLGFPVQSYDTFSSSVSLYTNNLRVFANLSPQTGKPYWRGRINTANLLILTSLDQLLFLMTILFTYVTKQAALLRSSTVLSLPVQLVFPVQSYDAFFFVTNPLPTYQAFPLTLPPNIRLLACIINILQLYMTTIASSISDWSHLLMTLQSSFTLVMCL